MDSAAVPIVQVTTVVQRYSPVYAPTDANADTMLTPSGWTVATPQTYVATKVSRCVPDIRLTCTFNIDNYSHKNLKSGARGED